jgi:hypothetical protein
MLTTNAARATPAATGRDPRGIDRAGGAINLTHNTPTLSIATFRDRAWWQDEACRLGSDWPAVVDLALDIIESTMFEPGCERACRLAEARLPPSAPFKPEVRPTPQTTIEAIMWCVRERGLKALQEPANIERLRRCDKAAIAQIDARLRKLKGDRQ